VSAQPICKGCGQLIRGSYILALDTTWHSEHLVCAACHQPLDSASFYQHQGKSYHIECYRRQIASRCTYCGKPLIGKYIVDSWGTKYCVEHATEYPACRFCGRLVPPRYQGNRAGSSGQVQCPLCRASAVESITQARPIFAGLVRWINRQELLYNNLDLRIKLCNQSQLTKYLHPAGDTSALGATWHSIYIQNGGIVRTEVNGVVIVRSLPPPLFQGVTVHELGHAWLIVHRIMNLPSWAEEGFCELLAHRFYSEMATAECNHYASCIESNPDSVYGEGFRRVYTLAKAVGFQHFVEVLRITKQLPSI